MFTSGHLPQAACAFQVDGIDDTMLRSLQSQSLAAYPPRSKGRSRTGMLLLYGDPTANVAVAPAVRWATEVWRSVGACGGPCCAVPQLKAMWESVSHVEGHTLWRNVRGPFGAARVCAARAGARFVSAFELEVGDTIFSLAVNSPGRVQQLLSDAARRKRQVAFSKSIGVDEGMCVDFAAVWKNVTKKAGLTNLERATSVTVAMES